MRRQACTKKVRLFVRRQRQGAGAKRVACSLESGVCCACEQNIVRRSNLSRSGRLDRRAFDSALGRAKPQAAAAEPPTRLREVAAFGANPGNLRMLEYVPATLAERPALLVVLHGCTQTAAGYDHGAGWTELADRHGFALLFPEQKPENNLQRCFSWFEPADVRRDGG